MYSRTLAPLLLLVSVASAEPPTRNAYLRAPDFWIDSSAGGNPVHQVDRAVFPVSGDSIRVELYYQASYGALVFQPLGSGFQARVRFDVSWTAEGSKVPAKRITEDRVVSADSSVVANADAFQLLHQVTMRLPGDAYWVESELRNVGGDDVLPVAQSHFWCDLAEDGPSGLRVGDLQLAANIGAAEPDADFVKGRYQVLPNPPRRYSKERYNLLFYMGMYYAGSDSMSFQARYRITDLYGASAREFAGGIALITPGFKARFGGLNVVTLTNGFYRLVVEFVDADGQVVLSRERNFQFRTPGEPPSLPDLYVTTLTDEETQGYGAKFLKNIGSPDDPARYEAIADPAAQRRFIEQWWQSDAEERGLSTAEWRGEILRRFALVDQRYADPYREGWRSDRGRILVRYGEPLEIETRDFETDERAGEMWEFLINGERKFCYFVDRRGSGKYEMDATDIDGEHARTRQRPNFYGF